MKYIVTGGAGFVGSHVVDALLTRGDEVHIIDDLSSGKREHLHRDAVFHEMNLSDFEGLKKVFEGADGVFHLAAQARMQYSIAEPLLTHHSNTTGTLHVLLAARDCGVRRVVYSASSSAYGAKDVMPVIENMEASPIIPYAVMKFVGEKYCEMMPVFYDLETVSLRYFNVYGPRQTTDMDGAYATVIGIFCGKAEKGLKMPIVGDGLQKRDFTNVKDVVRANLLAMSSDKVGKGEILNIGTGVSYEIKKVAEMIGGEIEFIPKRPGEVHEVRADNSKARELIGWQPEVTFEQGIEELRVLHGLKEKAVVLSS